MATPIPDNAAPFTLAEVLAATGGAALGAPRAPEDVVARGVVTDSRRAGPGTLFVALRGERFDAHAFVPDVVRAGAAIVIVERGRGPGSAHPAVGASSSVLVEVDDGLRALGDLARAHVARWRAASPDARVAAVTGSAGKTTTKEILARLLGARGAVVATTGNLNNRIGLPSVCFGVGPSTRFLVLEMGMSVPGEIAELCRIAPPDGSIVVNVGLAHAEGVGGRAGVAREKGAVLEALGPAGVAVVPAADTYAVGELRRSRAATVRRFGRAGEAAEPGADYVVLSRTPAVAGAPGQVVLARGPTGETLDVALPLAGEAAALDLAAALALADGLVGAPLGADEASRALEGLAVAGRVALRVLGGDVLLVDDTYNANPDSMRAALATQAELASSRRRVVVLGEMRELGDHAEDAHDTLGHDVARSAPDVLVTLGGLADRTAQVAKAAGIAVVAAPDVDAGARAAAAALRDGDVVLVKASRGVRAERVVEALVAARPA